MSLYKDFYGNEVEFLFNAAKTTHHPTLAELEVATCTFYKDGALAKGYLCHASDGAMVKVKVDALTSEILNLERSLENLVFYE